MTPLYLHDLKIALVLMHDYAEDFDDEFHMGVCLWNRNNRDNWQEMRRVRDMQLEREMKRDDRQCREANRQYFGMRFF